MNTDGDRRERTLPRPWWLHDSSKILIGIVVVLSYRYTWTPSLLRILPLYDSPQAVSLFYIFDLCFSFSLYSCLIFYSFLFLSSFPLSFVHTHTHNIETRDLSFFCFVFPSLSRIEAERNLHRDWLERRCKLHSYWLSSSPSIRWWLREAAAERSIHSAAAGFSYLEPPFTHPPSIDQEEHYGRADCCVVSFFFLRSLNPVWLHSIPPGVAPRRAVHILPASSIHIKDAL